MRFYFRQPEVMCNTCDKIVAIARYPHKKFKCGDIIHAKDFKATVHSHKNEMLEGDSILCKQCFKRVSTIQQAKKIVFPTLKEKKAWWKFW